MQRKKFKAIRYDRPDYAAYSQRIAKYASEISGAGTIDELSHALEEFFADRACVETMETLAFIRCYQDCTDKFYQEEMQYMERFSVPEYWTMPNDLSEIPSKAMEQLSYEYAHLFFGECAGQFVETHLITILEEICGYCMIHEFETFLYTADAFQSEAVIAEYNRLTKGYDAGIDYSVCRTYMDAGALLVQNKGIYMFPRYLVSYALSDISAISIRLAYETDKGKGLAVYKRLCEMGGSMEYDDAMKSLGLPLPYTEQAIIAVKDYLAEKLELAEKFD